MLLTVNGPEGPHITEAVPGTSLRTASGLHPGAVARAEGILLGGYGGGWVTPATFDELPVSEKAARQAGATLGAGVVALLPPAVCPIGEMADVVRYMEGRERVNAALASTDWPNSPTPWSASPTAEQADPDWSASSRSAAWSKDEAPAATLTEWPGSCGPDCTSSPNRSHRTNVEGPAARRIQPESSPLPTGRSGEGWWPRHDPMEPVDPIHLRVRR